MESRVIMNSSNLQENFPKWYEDFFATNNLIISSPHIINRGNVTHLKEIKTRVVQKLPTKTYIGINIRNDEKIHFQSYTQFSYVKNDFEKKTIEIDINNIDFSTMKQTIKEKLLEHGIKQGINISILSENERGTGIATDSIEALLMAYVLAVLGGNLLPEQMNNYDNFIKSKQLKNIHKDTKDIITTNGGIAKEHINETLLFSASMQSNIGFGLESKKYLESAYPKATEFENSIGLKKVDLEPKKLMEFSIIGFGGHINEFYNTETYLNIQEEYDDILKYYKLFKKKTTTHIDMMNILYLKMFKATKDATINPNDEQIVNNSFSQINRVGSHQVFTEKHMDLYRKITSTLKKNFTFEDENFGLLPISSGKSGGAFLCITRPGVSRETIKKTILELNKTGYPAARLQYLSWEDGMSQETIKIEQFLDKKIYSEYIKKESVMLKQWHSNEKTIGIHNKLLKELPEGIIFDTIEKKIYIQKRAITHKELFSQSATVEIMNIVCNGKCKQHRDNSELACKIYCEPWTSSKALPISGYSKNKNELLSKIVLPLQKLVKKIYKKDFPIKCTGSMTEFTILFGKQVIPIFFIKTID